MLTFPKALQRREIKDILGTIILPKCRFLGPRPEGEGGVQEVDGGRRRRLLS